MRKPRDFDAELKALYEKASQLKDRKLIQLGELVIATGADVMPIEQLAGAMLAATDTKDTATTEGWRKRGEAFFQGSWAATGGARGKSRSNASDSGDAPPAASRDSAQ